MQLSHSRTILYLVAISITSSIPVSFAKSSSAEEGVNLLEQILQKMRNMPQIALGQRGQASAQLLANNTLQPLNNSDYLKNEQDQALPIPASMPAYQSQCFDQVSQAGSLGSQQRINGRLLTKSSESSQFRARSNFHAENKRFSPGAFSAAGPSIVHGDLITGKKTSANGFGGYSISASPPAACAPMVQGASNATIAPQANWHQAPREYQIVEQRPLMRDFRNTPIPVPAFGGAPSSVAGVGAVAGANNKGAPLFLARQKNVKLPSPNLAIALSPPAVITGIPLIRLGNSEKQVTAAMSPLGKLHKDYFHGWSVWSLQKNSLSDYSIQVFMRHGTVDAIRVFDSSFLRQDFGVSPGDELTRVKTKFGEPAFILSDKGPITSQNYIYPISQVGFQLSRAEKEKAPKIVSMLIFNVK